MSDLQTTPLQEHIAAAISEYSPADAAIAQMSEEFMPLFINGVKDREGYKAVHAARMVVKGSRVAVEKKRKELKADALEFGRAVDAEAKRIFALLEPIESHLAAEEDAYKAERERIKREEEERRQAVIRERLEKLHAVGAQLLSADVEQMDDEAFELALATATEAHEERKRKEAEEAAERARLEAEEAEKRRQEEERLRVEREKLEADRAAQREAEEKLAAERRKVEEERARLEAEARKRREEAEAKAAAERAAQEARERAEREAKEKAEREAEEAKRRAALLPEAEKIRAFAALIEGLEVPEVECASALREVVRQAADKVRELIPAEVRDAS